MFLLELHSEYEQQRLNNIPLKFNVKIQPLAMYEDKDLLTSLSSLSRSRGVLLVTCLGLGSQLLLKSTSTLLFLPKRLSFLVLNYFFFLIVDR